MLFSERARGQKSRSPPLFAPSLNFQRNIAHNQSSGFAVAPRVKGLNARGPLKVQSEAINSFGSISSGSNHSAVGAYSLDERETKIPFEDDQGRSLDRYRKNWIPYDEQPTP
jgi:hypothetical protein